MSEINISTRPLYGFIDTAYLKGRDPGALTQQLVAGGVDMIQIRGKGKKRSQLVEIGVAVVKAARPFRVPVIMNDDLEAAFEVDADGVHLGQEDWAAIPRDERTHRLANMRIVGISTHSLEQALEAERDGADYIAVGPIFPTNTKPGVAAVGLKLLREVGARVTIPFYAIGGITLDNVGEVLETGAKRVAVVSAILGQTDVKQATEAFKGKLEGVAL